MDEKYITFIIEVFYFISAFAAVVASILIFKVTKKFGSGILANGFKHIATGVLFISFGMIIDATTTYFSLAIVSEFVLFFMAIKGVCFILGTYIIVIGSKTTADKLETITR